MGVCAVVLLSVVAAVLWMLWRYSHWKRRGVPYITPLPLVGNMLDAVLFRKNGGLVMTDIYNKLEGVSCAGVYKFLQPALLVRDPELVKDILVKHFSSFQDNELQLSDSHDPMLSKSPFTTVQERWKQLRADFAPSFTPAKVRSIHPTLNATADGLVQYLEGLGHQSGRGDGAETKDVASRYSTNVTVSIALGLEGGAFEKKQSVFMDMGYRLLGDSWFTAIRISLLIIFPAYLRLLRMRFVPIDVENFFKRLVKDASEARKMGGINRKDFLETITKSDGPMNDNALTEAAGKMVVFFLESFETSSTTITSALLNLARFPETQKKLRKELLEAFPDRTMNIDVAVTLPYLDNVVMEAMRVYELLPVMTRVCTSPITLYPEGQSPVHVEEGTSVVIPVNALHHDPKHFPDPERFDPDRFTPEIAETRHKFTFLPFGEGPRICIGMRYGLALTKAAIAAVVLNFDLELSPKQHIPPKRDARSGSIAFDGGVWLRYIRR